MEDVSAERVPVSDANLSLEALEGMDDSVLGAALRRLHREARGAAEGITVHHSQTHSSSHSNTGPW